MQSVGRVWVECGYAWLYGCGREGCLDHVARRDGIKWYPVGGIR